MEDLMAKDPRLVLLLGDIGVFGFRNAFRLHSDRTYNIGICEQAMTGLAAGLAKEQLLPVIHSIAPFVVERCFEQLKVDLCYQRLPAKIVSVGASYDYASLGCTHHCPGDVAILRNLPGMEIVVPGTPAEFDRLFRSRYASESPGYFRLSEGRHTETTSVEFGRAEVLRRGHQGTIVAVGPMLSSVLEASREMDVSVLYYTTLAPFDAATLRENSASGAIAVVGPFYEDTLTPDIMAAVNGRATRLLSIGIPRRFLTNYGKAATHDKDCALTAPQLNARLQAFFDGKI